MTRWQPYPEYRESGLPWLAEVPVHWDIQRLKHISSVTLSSVDKRKIEGERPVHLCNYVDVYYNDYITADLEFMEATASPEEVRRFTLKEGDVIITKDSESWDDIAVSAYVPSDLEGVLCGYHLALIRPDQQVIDSKYLFQSFCASRINEQFTVEATGITRYGLAKHWIDNASFLVPPLPEQRAIAAFLDHQTAKIDALTAEQRRLIELLQERRVALISHAVTKGLDPDVPMKDSGIPWLGGIPRHWEVVCLKFVAHVQSGVAKGRNLEGRQTVEIPYLRVANVQSGFVDLSDVATITIGKDEIERYSLKAGDILMTEGGDYDKLGRGTVWEGQIHPCVHQNHIFAVRARLAASPYWISALTQADYARHYFILRSKQSTNLASISMTNIMELPVILPPTPEQDRILSHLDRETAKIDTLLAEIETHMAHLEEYRTALISAAVTGKIDVRDALPPDVPAQPRLTDP
jgi:type I restriction enzyme S subunit